MVLVAYLRPASTVDHSKFRTCQQGSFCRRYTQYVGRVEASSGTEFAHAIDAGSLHHEGHTLRAKVVHVNDDEVPPLMLKLSFFRDDLEGKCGIMRLYLAEERPLHPRFRIREGDVVIEEASLRPDEVRVVQETDRVNIVSSNAGGCEVTLRHRPLELDYSAGGKLLQRFNARHLLNFEQYRLHGAPVHKGLVDATDVDTNGLWEEHFGGHKDLKPRGPAAVAVDVTFEAASHVVGAASHAAGVHLQSSRFESHEPYRFFNLDVFEYALDVPMALYGSIPLVTAIHQSGDIPSASGFFVANPSEGFLKVDTPDRHRKGDATTWWAFESGVIDLFIFAGPTPQKVLQQYHTVTGWPRLPLLSSLGKHQCRWNYVDVEDALAVNKKFDQHDIPYDFLWLDIEHTDGKRYFTWHPSHFANPEPLLDALAESKRKLVTVIDPHIKKDDKYPIFKRLQGKDYFTKTSNGQPYEGWCWPGAAYYPDFCNPAVRDEWAKFFKLDKYAHSRPDLYTWNDMNEPSVFNGPEVTMPRDNLHKCDTKTYGVEHRDVHNIYGFYHHMASVQGQLERAPDIRPFVLTRSFFAGSHRHSAVWTGDNMARWDHVAISVPMLLSMSLCGMSFVGPDVPGFFHDPSVELFKRWHQLGIWYPFYRAHAHLETKRREPWTFGDEVTAVIRDQVTVRYQMLPVWYTLFAEWSMLGLPVMRPIWYHNLDDRDAFDYVDEEYLVGEAILVRPIVEMAEARSVDMYLPRGSWYDFWDPRAPPSDGGRVLKKQLHPGHVPVMVRSGHILFKKMRRRRSTGAMVADPYTIVVYGQSASGRVYVDDGFSHSFQGGAYIYDTVTFDGATLEERPASQALHGIPAAQGLSAVPPRNLHIERVVFIGLANEPRSAQLMRHGAEAVEHVQATSERAGSSWIATVKKPLCQLGTSWSLKLLF